MSISPLCIWKYLAAFFGTLKEQIPKKLHVVPGTRYFFSVGTNKYLIWVELIPSVEVADRCFWTDSRYIPASEKLYLWNFICVWKAVQNPNTLPMGLLFCQRWKIQVRVPATIRFTSHLIRVLQSVLTAGSITGKTSVTRKTSLESKNYFLIIFVHLIT